MTSPTDQPAKKAIRQEEVTVDKFRTLAANVLHNGPFHPDPALPVVEREEVGALHSGH
jgi:hypothetical protein